MQTVETRHRRTWRLIRTTTVCLQNDLLKFVEYEIFHPTMFLEKGDPLEAKNTPMNGSVELATCSYFIVYLSDL